MTRDRLLRTPSCGVSFEADPLWTDVERICLFRFPILDLRSLRPLHGERYRGEFTAAYQGVIRPVMAHKNRSAGARYPSWLPGSS